MSLNPRVNEYNSGPLMTFPGKGSPHKLRVAQRDEVHVWVSIEAQLSHSSGESATDVGATNVPGQWPLSKSCFGSNKREIGTCQPLPRVLPLTSSELRRSTFQSRDSETWQFMAIHGNSWQIIDDRFVRDLVAGEAGRVFGAMEEVSAVVAPACQWRGLGQITGLAPHVRYDITVQPAPIDH
jgi:hypothetical protein